MCWSFVLRNHSLIYAFVFGKHQQFCAERRSVNFEDETVYDDVIVTYEHALHIFVQWSRTS